MRNINPLRISHYLPLDLKLLDGGRLHVYKDLFQSNDLRDLEWGSMLLRHVKENDEGVFIDMQDESSEGSLEIGSGKIDIQRKP